MTRGSTAESMRPWWTMQLAVFVQVVAGHNRAFLASERGGGSEVQAGAEYRVTLRAAQHSRIAGQQLQRQQHVDDVQEYETDGPNRLDSNIWTSSGMSLDFRKLDDLEPVAPMDAIALGSHSAGPVTLSGDKPQAPQAQFVPPYLHPDAFPAVGGRPCVCNNKEVLSCKCHDDPETVGIPWRWAEDHPVLGSDVPQELQGHVPNVGQEELEHYYTVTPADATYSHGSYWRPRLKDGLVAPMDRMPARSYPVQASGDHIEVLPASAREDRIGSDFARYIDQVEQRSSECDTLTSRCTVPCRASDSVELQVGNLALEAIVVTPGLANTLVVRFRPSKDAVGVYCHSSSGCTAFSSCLTRGHGCVEMKDEKWHDFRNTLNHRQVCPVGTMPCGVIEQIVSATYVRKNGQACRADLSA